MRQNVHNNVLNKIINFYRDLEEAIENIWLQVKSVIVSNLEKKDQQLESESENTLKAQITALAKKDSPVRQLMWKRLIAYVRLVKTMKTLPPAPPGFTEFNDELQSIANAFARLSFYNYSVFGEHLEKILNEVLKLENNDSSTQSEKITEKEVTAGPSKTDSES